jgi:hypothetical protein
VSGGTPTQDFGTNGCRIMRTGDLPLFNAMCWRDSWIAGSVLEAHRFVKRSGKEAEQRTKDKEQKMHHALRITLYAF